MRKEIPSIFYFQSWPSDGRENARKGRRRMRRLRFVLKDETWDLSWSSVLARGTEILRFMSSGKCLCKSLYGTFKLEAKRKLVGSPQEWKYEINLKYTNNNFKRMKQNTHKKPSLNQVLKKIKIFSLGLLSKYCGVFRKQQNLCLSSISNIYPFCTLNINVVQWFEKLRAKFESF